MGLCDIVLVTVCQLQGSGHMGTEVKIIGAIGLAVGEEAMHRLNIERYQELLRGSLGPKARKMFEILLARARSDLEAG